MFVNLFVPMGLPVYDLKEYPPLSLYHYIYLFLKLCYSVPPQCNQCEHLRCIAGGGQGGGGAGIPTREYLLLHFNVNTTWWLKSDTPSAYLGGCNHILL